MSDTTLPELPQPAVRAFCRAEPDHDGLYTTDQMRSYAIAAITAERARAAAPAGTDCTEPNRAACPRMCIDFCNKQEQAAEPRFFIDHGVIHDRVTGRHVHGDREVDPGSADACVAMLNDLAAHASERTELIVSARRAIEAWDSSPLPRANDGMMQERMEDLRAARGMEARSGETEGLDPEGATARSPQGDAPSPKVGAAAPAPVPSDAFDERSAFEKAFSCSSPEVNRRNFIRHKEGFYVEHRIDALWDGWKARSALSEALPYTTTKCPESGLMCGYWISYFSRERTRLQRELKFCEGRIHNQREEINRLAALAEAAPPSQEPKP